MPAGDPAGYLPNVKNARRYRPRKRGRPLNLKPPVPKVGVAQAVQRASRAGETDIPVGGVPRRNTNAPRFLRKKKRYVPRGRSA